MDRRETPARPGLLVDGYALVARRNDHGLGDVWLAQRPHQPDDEALIKFVAPIQGDAVVPKVFDETLKKVQRATSPGLVTVRRWGVVESWLYVVTEVIEARPLEDWIAGYREAGTRPPPGVALWLFDALCAAVQSAHRQGIAHGAISPRSVLLHPLSPGAYHAWILDLGLATWILDASAVSVVEPPPAGYVAPEQLDPNAAVTPRADLFALSLLLVELLTLTPSPGSVSREPLARIVLRDHAHLAEHLRKLRDDVPDEFWSALAETLHPDPSRRPESAQQLKTRIRNAAHQCALWRDVPEPVPEPPTPTAARALAGDAAAAAKARGAAPEGWQHAERLPSKVDPEALKSMLSVAARKRRATTNTNLGILVPPASAPSPPPPATPAVQTPRPLTLPPEPSHLARASMPTPFAPPRALPAEVVTPTPAPLPSFAAAHEVDEGTTRTSSEQVTAHAYGREAPYSKHIPVEVTSPATALPEADALPDATLQPSFAWNVPAVLEAAAAPPAAPMPAPEKPRRARTQTRAIDEDEVSQFVSTRPEPKPHETVAASRGWSPPTDNTGYDDSTTRPAVNPSDFEAETTIKPPRAGAVPATVDVAGPMQTLTSGARPATMPPPAPRPPTHLGPPRPLTVPPPSYAPPHAYTPPHYAAAPSHAPHAPQYGLAPAEPFVLKPLDAAPPRKSNSNAWVFVIAGVIVMAAAVVALLIVLS